MNACVINLFTISQFLVWSRHHYVLLVILIPLILACFLSYSRYKTFSPGCGTKTLDPRLLCRVNIWRCKDVLSSHPLSKVGSVYNSPVRKYSASVNLKQITDGDGGRANVASICLLQCCISSGIVSPITPLHRLEGAVNVGKRSTGLLWDRPRSIL